MEVCLSDLISICQGPSLKVSLDIYGIHIKSMLNIMMGSSTCVKWKKHETLTCMEILVHHGLIYWTKL